MIINTTNDLPFKLDGIAKEILDAAPSVTLAGTVEELTELAVRDAK